MDSKKDHFRGQSAQQHIVEVQANGVITSAEVHGAETPGSLFATIDAMREISLLFALLLLLLPALTTPLLLALLAAVVVWKGGRAAFLAFYRLERLHRVVKEEQREIQENRSQEKEELKELYRLKGFEGKLLDDVVDVLMADGDRALRVMLQEEMGFRLEENEHPIVQGIGASLGALLGGAVALLSFLSFGLQGLFLGVGCLFVLAGVYSARREKNRVISAVVWTLFLGAATLATGYFLI